MEPLTALDDSPIALTDTPARVDPPTEPLTERYPEILAAFGEVAERIAGVDRLDAILHQVARKACELLGVERCSVYLKDEESGLFRGQVGETGGNDDEEIKRLTAGGPSDRFTQQILQERKPVLLRNAQTDLRPVRATMRRWGIETMLGVPMSLNRDVVGLLFLDSPNRSHTFTRADEATAAAFGNLAATAISQVRLTERLRSNLNAANRHNGIMRRAQGLDDELAERLARGTNLHEIVATVSELTGKPCALHDADFAQLAVSAAPGGDGNILPRLLDDQHRDHREVRDSLARAREKGVVMVGPLAAAGLPHRFMVAPVSHSGHLLLMEYPVRFSTLDLAAMRRTATMLTLVLSNSARRAEADAHDRVALARDLLLGTDSPESLEHRAEKVGVSLEQPFLAALFRHANPDEPLRAASADDVASLVTSADAGLSRAWAAQVPNGLAVILPIGDDSAPRATEAVRGAAPRIAQGISSGGAMIAAISSPISGANEFSTAYREILEVAKCAELCDRADGEIRVLSVDDMGPMRLFMSAADPRDLERFATDVLGALVEYEDDGRQDLLETLDAFFRTGQRVRGAAAALDVHQNTVRYRIGKIEQITGLDLIDEPNDRLSCQMALKVLKLTGAVETGVPARG